MLEPTDLLGEWRLARTMTEHRTGQCGTAAGRLLVSRYDDGLSWVETVTVTWQGRSVPATRTYLLAEETDGWWVRFDDGRPFHPWSVGTAVEHLCGTDVYTGLVRVDDGDVRVRWDVTGPAKDLTLETVLSR